MAAVALLFWPKVSKHLGLGRRRRYTLSIAGQNEENRWRQLLSTLGVADMDKLCRQAGRPDLTGRKLLTYRVVLAVVLAVFGYAVGGFFFALLLAAGGWYLVRFWIFSQAETRKKQIEFELPTFLDLWGLLTSAGESVESALVEITRRHPDWVLSGEMRLVLDRVASSGLLGESLVRGARETGCQDLIDVAEQVKQVTEGGGKPSTELARIADRLRTERMVKLAQDAAFGATVGALPKMGGMFLSLLPVIACIVLTAMDAFK